MKVLPILTEKSLNLAKAGKYSFWLNVALTKTRIKKLISEIYGVHVTSVKTLRYKGGERKNTQGRKIRIPERKKAIATLKEGEKIDVFEVKKEKKTK